MEIDLEELGKILYPDGIPEGEDFRNYIIHLASCGTEKLVKESSYLKEERSLILEETRDLVYKNYKTFIHSADCSQKIFTEFSNVENHLEKVIHGLPSLRENVEEFLKTSRSLSHSRHTTSLTLMKHTQLLEILELPQLMDTCVRNGYYDDALEILSYAKRLEKKHLDIPLIATIVTEVKNGTRLMLLQLLLQLRSSLTLPQCLKMVGLLRRLDVFSDAELKLKFLQARDTWFSGMIRSIPEDDPFHHITKVVETYRVHLFDIVTQYRAIFSDEDSYLGIADSDINESVIFHGWIIHKVNSFLKILQKDLKKGVGSNLESLLDQCMFFGQSFSRIGVDFRTLLIPVFQDAAFLKFEADVRSANVKFDESMCAFTLMDASQLHPSSVLLSEVQDKTNPPLALMAFPPLAHYTNGIMVAFNGLRQCCPLALLKKVRLLLTSSITKVVMALRDLHQMEGSGFTASEEKSFSQMCYLLPSALIPHVNSCLRFLFPLQAIADVTGVPVAELHKQNHGQLNIESITSTIAHFMPKNQMEGSKITQTQEYFASSDNNNEETESQLESSIKEEVVTAPEWEDKELVEKEVVEIGPEINKNGDLSENEVQNSECSKELIK